MSEAAFAKCSCQSCAVHLEYPVASEGATITCPRCGQTTVLIQPTAGGSSPPSQVEESSPEVSDGPVPAMEFELPGSGLSIEALQAAFPGPVARTKVSLLYQFGLIVVTIAMVALPLIYLAVIAGTGWLTWYWATHFTPEFSGTGRGRGRVAVMSLLLYLTPLFAGTVLVFFLVKPLFARRPQHAQPLAVNPEAEPLLFAFVARICEIVGAPLPRRIDVDCNLNASASFRRGWGSLLNRDLVLTIGLPLVGGLTLRQLAGVLAHEFGHFTQGFGMRLTYVIRSVNGWFARVVFERDAWDQLLVEWSQVEDARLAIVVNTARLGVWCSRIILHGLMLVGHGIGCFMLRQMEYDADSYEIKVAGSQTFEETMRRFHVLGHLLDPSYKGLRASWNLNRQLPDDFSAYLAWQDHRLNPIERQRLEDTLGLEASGWFDTHPSHGDRIRRARQAALPGVFDLDAPAQVLFSNFPAVSKQVTLLHYSEDLGLPIETAVLKALNARAEGA